MHGHGKALDSARGLASGSFIIPPSTQGKLSYHNTLQSCTHKPP